MGAGQAHGPWLPPAPEMTPHRARAATAPRPTRGACTRPPVRPWGGARGAHAERSRNLTCGPWRPPRAQPPDTCGTSTRCTSSGCGSSAWPVAATRARDYLAPRSSAEYHPHHCEPCTVCKLCGVKMSEPRSSNFISFAEKFESRKSRAALRGPGLILYEEDANFRTRAPRA